MADDWQPGDLALCVRDGEVECPDCGGSHAGKLAPKLGTRHIVARISRCGSPEHCYPGLEDNCAFPVLYLLGGQKGLASRFRKIRPHTPDAEDAETIRLLTGAPVREPAA